MNKQQAAEALEKLNGFIFSDGPGPVCAWVNEYQTFLKSTLQSVIDSPVVKDDLTTEMVCCQKPQGFECCGNPVPAIEAVEAILDFDFDAQGCNFLPLNREQVATLKAALRSPGMVMVPKQITPAIEAVITEVEAGAYSFEGAWRALIEVAQEGK